MESDINPYVWNGTDLLVHVVRASLLEKIRKELLSGSGSAYLLGGTGTGKSVFLRDLQQDLRRVSGVQPILFDLAIVETVEKLQRDFVERLVETCPDGSETLIGALRASVAHPDPRRSIEIYLDQRPDIQMLVLLYDEPEGYSDKSGAGRQWIKILESVRRASSRKLKLFAAGGLRLFSVGDSLASPFLSRARRYVMPPFDEEDLQELAKPLIEKKGDHLPDDMIEQILLGSGGNAALATYGLQELWQGTPDAAQDVVEIYQKFRREDGGFLQRIRRTIADKHVSKLPSLLWTAVLHGGGAIRQEAVRELFDREQNDLAMEVGDVIALLQAAGLARLESSVDDNPIRISAIPSIVHFEPRQATSESATLAAVLVDDLSDILGLLHSMTLDFFSHGEVASEALFSAFIASNLLSRGWDRAEREAILGAGHADIKATHGRFPGKSAVIEVKIWPRNHEGIHEQVALYWSRDVEAGAAVMFDVRQDVSKWRSQYESDCLRGKADWAWKKPRSPLHSHAVATSTLSSNVPIAVDHLLIHLQRAPSSKRRVSVQSDKTKTGRTRRGPRSVK